jgi:hypothetical protein
MSEFCDLGMIYHTFICTCFCFATIFSINPDCVTGAYENAIFISSPDFLETFRFSEIRGFVITHIIFRAFSAMQI